MSTKQDAAKKKRYDPKYNIRNPPTRLRLTTDVLEALSELAAAQEPPTDLEEKGALPAFLRGVILAYRDMVLHQGRYEAVCPYCRRKMEETATGWTCPVGHGEFIRAEDTVLDPDS